VKVSAAVVAVWTAAVCVAAAGGCGGSDEAADPRTPLPAPEVTLTAEEKEVWAPLPPDRSAIPVLLYHGIGPASDFANEEDAAYGVDRDDFAKQMTMIRHAGYETVDLATFVDFVRGRKVDLPPRPLLLTFDDARADSWAGADAILEELGLEAVMFVDVGRVDDGDAEYLTWDELRTVQSSGRWQLQLHSGHGHQQIRYGPGDDDYGPFYAYEDEDEDEGFDGWRERVRSDIEWGQDLLADHVRTFRPLAFAPPYGNYGQDGTNDARIPGDLLDWLTQRFEAIFTQDRNARARAGSGQPLGRIQVTRATSGGELHERLLTGQ
jgi:peptidoglycan/xylan/chitin deacetylase (PgdA/CDA1 family)